MLRGLRVYGVSYLRFFICEVFSFVPNVHKTECAVRHST